MARPTSRARIESRDWFTVPRHYLDEPNVNQPSIVARLEAQGTLVDEGRFSVDWARALELLGERATSEAGEWLPLILQVGGLLGATRMDVSCGSDVVEVRWTGVVLSWDDLTGPWTSHRTLYKLAVAQAMAVAQGTGAIEVTASGLLARYVDQKVEVEPARKESDPVHDATRIRLRRLVTDLGGVGTLRDLVSTRCYFSNIPIYTDDESVSRGWAAAFDGRTVDVKADGVRVVGMAGYTLSPAPAVLEVLVGGVHIEAIQLSEYGPGFVAVVDLDIELDLSQRKVVRGESFQRLLGWISEAAESAPRASEQDRSDWAACAARLDHDGEIINDDVFLTPSGDALERVDLPESNSEWLPFAIQAAVFLGARVVKVWWEVEGVVNIRFDGPEFTPYELYHPWRALDIATDEPRRKAIHKLAYAISLAELDGFDVTISTSSHRARYMGRQVHIQPERGRGTILRAVQGNSGPTRPEPARPRVKSPHGLQDEDWEFTDRVRHSRISISAGPEVLSHGWESLFDVIPHVDVLDAAGRTIGAAGFRAGSSGVGEAQVYVGGVLIERIPLTTLEQGFAAVVDVDLPLDGSQQQLLRGEDYNILLAAISRAHDLAPRPTAQDAAEMESLAKAREKVHDSGGIWFTILVYWPLVVVPVAYILTHC